MSILTADEALMHLFGPDLTLDDLYKKHPSKKFYKLLYKNYININSGLNINKTFTTNAHSHNYFYKNAYLDIIIPQEELFNSEHYFHSFHYNPYYPTYIAEVFFNDEASDPIIRNSLFHNHGYIVNKYICGKPVEFTSPFIFDIKEPTIRGEKISDGIINDKYKLYKLVLSYNGLLLRYINEQTYELCEIAVKENGMAIKHVQEEFLTPELCKLAVQETGFALEYIKEQTLELCKIAIEDYVGMFNYVNPELQTSEELFALVNKKIDLLML